MTKLSDREVTRLVLIGAREVLSDPARWTQHVWARDADGIATSRFGNDAVCWCVSGAIQLVVAGMLSDPNAATRAAKCAVVCFVQAACKSEYVTDWNDWPMRQHAEVISGFDAAIVSVS